MSEVVEEEVLVVEGLFGEKKVTKEEFIKEWTSHVRQLHRLSYDQAEYFNEVIEKVAAIAEKEFNLAIEGQKEK